MRRTILALTLCTATALSPALAGAQTDRPSERPPERPPAEVDTRPDTRPEARPERPDERPDRVRFDCRARRIDRADRSDRGDRGDRGAVVTCRWSAATSDRVAGYRLLRAVDDGGRRTVFATRDRDRNGYRERVRPGHRYHYAVQYLAADGTVLHTADAVHLAV